CEQRARPGVDSGVAGADSSNSLHDSEPGPLADLVVAELLTRRKADHDRARSIDRLEHRRRTYPRRRLDFLQIPGLHTAILGAPSRATLAHPGIKSPARGPSCLEGPHVEARVNGRRR